MIERILQANLNNFGGAFSVAFEAQKKLTKEYIFDYFSPDPFVQNAVYDELMRMGSKCVGTINCPNRFLKQFTIYKTLVKYLNENDYKYVDFCITSASCTLIEAWEECGKFDEWMFIDLVDNDFCKRIILSGYKILKLNRWVLDQEFGEIIPKSQSKQKFWFTISKIFRNQNFAKFSYKKFVSPMRVYYTNRNIIYLNKKMKKYGTVGYENYNCKSYLGFIICFMLPSIFRAQEKAKVIKATINGIKDGVNTTPIEWVKWR